MNIGSIKKFIVRCWNDGTQIGRENVLAAVYLGGGTHFLLYFVYKHFFDLYENIYLRAIAVFLCVTVGLRGRVPEKYRYLFPFYWHLMLIVAWPFMLSVNLFKTNFNETWLYWEIVMVLLLAMHVPNWLIYVIDLLIGVGGAYLYFVITTPEAVLNLDFDIYAWSIVCLFSGVAGLIFVHGNRNVWLRKQAMQHKKLSALAHSVQNKKFAALAGSIAHEVRSPLNTINLSANQIKDLTSKLENEEEKKRVDYVMGALFGSIKRSNDVIDILLSQLKGKEIDSKYFKNLSARGTIAKSIKEYGYKNEGDKSRVSMEVLKDFAAKASETLLMHVYFNLIKNALYYPNSTVKIYDKGSGKIVVEDTGPGIGEDRVGSLFQDFETSGKVGGTGLGLSFCKRVMEGFGGSIKCESEVGKWTKFILSFPKVEGGVAESADDGVGLESGLMDMEEVKKILKGKEILIVDDEKLSLTMLSAFLRKNGMRVQKFSNAKDLLGRYKDQFEGDRDEQGKINKYTIITDVNMPEMTGGELIREVRLLESARSVQGSAVIIAYSADNDEEKMVELKKDGANDCFVKGGDLDGLLKVLAVHIDRP